HSPLGHHRQAARLPRAQGGDPRPAIEEAREDAYLRPRLANVPLEYAKRLLDPIPAGAAALLPTPCGATSSGAGASGISLSAAMISSRVVSGSSRKPTKSSVATGPP